jgi:hypothetical protein
MVRPHLNNKQDGDQDEINRSRKMSWKEGGI